MAELALPVQRAGDEGAGAVRRALRGQGPGAADPHKLALAEMLVPYSDARKTWSFRNAFDVGEYGTGRRAHSLDPLVDVPPHAVFFDGHFATDTGEPSTIERAAAVYERDGGRLWKHLRRGATR